MKKTFGMLILVFLLTLPLSASAGYIGTYYMNVDASTPSAWPSYPYLADYDGTLDGISYEVFCVEAQNMNGGTVLYDFYTIDESLKNIINIDIYDEIVISTWYAGEFAASNGILTEADDAAKAAAQINIWDTMFPANATSSSGYDDYIDDWLLAVIDDDNDPYTILWNSGNQNYLVPVPEPANMFLMGTGLLGLAAIGGRRYFKK